MEPVLFQSLSNPINLVAVILFLQIGIITFLTGKRHLRLVSIFAVSLVGGLAGGNAAAQFLPSAGWIFVIGGIVGGGLLGYFLRPVGVGLALAYIGSLLAGNLVNIPFVQVVVAMDLFAYGLLLTDLAPILVSSLLASSILLASILWLGAPAPVAFILAAAIGGSRFMASNLPSKLSMRGHTPSLSPTSDL